MGDIMNKEFLVLWVGTTVASFGMEIKNELRLFKDVADAGYKINATRLSELGNQLNPGALNKILVSMLIPIYNVIQVCQKVVQYNNARPMLLAQLDAIGALEEMSEFEKAEYQKNPTALNAILVPLKSEARLPKASSVKIRNDDEYSEIYYELGKTVNDITILKANGLASRLTVEEQKAKVVEAMKYIAQAGVKKYGDIDTFVSTLFSEGSMSLAANEGDTRDENAVSKDHQELTTSEQIQELEQLKRELLDSKKEKQSTADKGAVYQKNRK